MLKPAAKKQVAGYIVAGYIVAGYIVAGYIVAGYIVAGYIVAGYIVAGYIVAGYIQEEHQFSKRKSCALVGIPTCTARYQSRKADEAPVRTRLKELAQERPRFGYRRLGVLLRREGHKINLKRVLRLYREENLKLRARKRKRVVSTLRVKPEGPVAINQMWTMDFMHDTLNGGRRFRTLNLVDCWSREALAVEVDTSLSGQRVVGCCNVCSKRAASRR